MTAASLLRSTLTGLIIGLTAIVFSVSFAAIIYKGDLAPFLSRGIGLTLIGAAIMAAVGTFVMSYRGTIVQPQDVTALILALSAATIAADWEASSPDALFATVATLVITATATAGIVSFTIGRARLGFIARFVPYPVLGGFLAATGYLLTMGALGMILRENVTLTNLGTLFEPGSPQLWAPWAAVGVLLCLINRRARNGFVLPVSILVLAAGFYVALAIPGIDFAEARALGLLLGPFDDAPLYAGLGPSLVIDADWSMILRQLPAIIAVSGMTVVGALLYASALELATGEDIDSDKDLRGVGLSNILAALGGGMVGYHLLSQTLFARTLGVTTRVAGLAVAAVTVATVAFGATYLSVLPIGIFAAVILFLGLDLLITWLWTERRRLPRADFALVLLILVAAATLGFLEAIALGILAACFQFVLTYARTDVVTLRTTAATLRSRTERNAADLEHLAACGDQVLVYALSGHLFFGTAHRLQSELIGRIAAPGGRFQEVLLDFRRVTGIDASACFSLQRLDAACRGNDVRLVLCNVSQLQRERLSLLRGDDAGFVFCETLDDALREVEERLLADRAPAAVTPQPADLIDRLKAAHPDVPLDAVFSEETVRAGDVVIEQGHSAGDMILLRQGRLRVEYQGDAGITVLATVLPGALVGEIGFYSGIERTARVVAEQDCRLLRLQTAELEVLTRAHPAVAATFHRFAAADLAARLTRVSALLRDGTT